MIPTPRSSRSRHGVTRAWLGPISDIRFRFFFFSGGERGEEVGSGRMASVCGLMVVREWLGEWVR